MVAETRVRRSPEFEAAQESYIDLLTQQVGRAPGTAGIPTLAQLGPQVAGVDPLTQAAQQRAATQAGLGQLTFTPEGTVSGIGTGTGVAGFQPFLDQAAKFQTDAATTLGAVPTDIAAARTTLGGVPSDIAAARTTLGGVPADITAARALTGPTAFQQFMSPYQQQVIQTTLDEFDKQAASGIPALQAQAIGAGAFGGGREGVQLAEYQAQSDKNRAALQAQLLQQGFTQAQNLAQQDFARRQALTGLQQNLAQSQLGLGTTQQSLAQSQLGLGTTTGGLATSQLGLGEFSRGLASLQPSLEAATQQQLGTAGTGALSLRQALLDADQQRAQLAYQEPISRIQALGSGLASQVGGVPTTTQTLGTTQPVASPLSQALQVGLTAYGLGNIFGGN
jgi:hypothetical protein